MKLLKLAFGFLHYRSLAWAMKRNGKGVYLLQHVVGCDELEGVMGLVAEGGFEDFLIKCHPKFYNQVKDEFADVFALLKDHQASQSPDYCEWCKGTCERKNISLPGDDDE